MFNYRQRAAWSCCYKRVKRALGLPPVCSLQRPACAETPSSVATGSLAREPSWVNSQLHPLGRYCLTCNTTETLAEFLNNDTSHHHYVSHLHQFIPQHPRFLLSLVLEPLPAGTHCKLFSSYLLRYLGAAFPMLTEVGGINQRGSRARLPGPSCSCLLYVFILLSNSPPEREELDPINSVLDKHIHSSARKETSVTLLTASVPLSV